MLLHWAAVMLCWLLGIALQLQQAWVSALAFPRELMPWMSLGTAAGMLALVALMSRMDAQESHADAPHAGHHSLVRIVCLLLAVWLGWQHAQWQAQERLSMHWPASMESQTVVLTGYVDSMPVRAPWGTRIEVRVRDYAWADGRCQAAGPWPQTAGRCPDRVALTWGSPPSRVLPGDLWQWTVRLRAPAGQLNPGGFDAEQWSFNQRLRAQGKVVEKIRHPDTGDVQMLVPSRLHAAQGLDQGWLDRWRARLASRVEAAVGHTGMAGLMVGLTLGEQQAIDDAQWTVLRNTGIAHLAAISGLHITMVGWLAGVVVGTGWRRSKALLRWCPAVVVRRWSSLWVATLYALLAGWGIPAQRTVIMLGIVVVLQSSGRRWPWPLVLLLAATCVTWVDPFALSEASFWLSFAAVGFLMLNTSPNEPVQPGMSGQSWWREQALAMWKTQYLATLGLAPLSLVFFHAVSLVGLGVNLVCVPWFTLVITPLALLGHVWPGAWHWTASLLSITMQGLGRVAGLRGVVWQTPDVQPWAVGLALVGTAILLLPLPWRWRLACWPMCVFLCWPVDISLRWPVPAAGHVRVVAADVGQGTAVLIQTHGHTMLYDAGPRISESSDSGLTVLLGLLRALNISGLDLFMISHGDMDHVGGAASVLANMRVMALSTSLEAGHPLLSQHDVRGRLPSHQSCQSGQHWQWDGVDFRVLHPSGHLPADTPDNARSCVLQIQAQGRRVLVTGDLEADQEAQLVDREGARLHSEVLLVPHHGSKTSSTDVFLDAVRPSVGVIQAGRHNRYGHPHPKVVQRYGGRQIPLVQSPACGAWFWSSQDSAPDEALGHCWRQEVRRYWHAPIARRPSAEL